MTIKPVHRKPWDGTVLKPEHFAEEHVPAFRAAKRRVKTRQIGGDDGYHYCLIIDGRIRLNGMTRSEATHYMDRAILNIMNGQPWHDR